VPGIGRLLTAEDDIADCRCPAVSADKGWEFDGIAIREVNDNLVVVLLQ
jgi:hypothetical protein